MLGYTFNRQKPLGNYIVDFYCSKLSLVIEVDGSSHESEEAIVKDNERQKILEDMGLNFIRIDDSEVKLNLPNVLHEIESFILDWRNLQTKKNQNPPAPL